MKTLTKLQRTESKKFRLMTLRANTDKFVLHENLIAQNQMNGKIKVTSFQLDD